MPRSRPPSPSSLSPGRLRRTYCRLVAAAPSADVWRLARAFVARSRPPVPSAPRAAAAPNGSWAGSAVGVHLAISPAPGRRAHGPEPVPPRVLASGTALNQAQLLSGAADRALAVGYVDVESAGFAAGWFCRIMREMGFEGSSSGVCAGRGRDRYQEEVLCWPRKRRMLAGGEPNQSLQQTKPPVTSPACAGAAPAVFAAEACC